MKHVKLDDLLLDPDQYDLEVITHSVRAEVLKAYDRSIEKFDRAWAKRHPQENGAAGTLVEQLAKDCVAATARLLRAAIVKKYFDVIRSFSTCYDNELVSLSRKGEDEKTLILGFFQLVVADVYKVSKEAKRLCPVPEDRMDYHRDALVTLIEKLDEGNLHFESGVKPYFEGIFINHCLNGSRKRKRRSKKLSDNTEKLIGMLSGHGVEFDPERRLYFAEAIEIIKAVDKECYEFLARLISSGGGYSYEEVAARENVSAATLRQRARRCRTMFFNRVQELKAHYYHD